MAPQETLGQNRMVAPPAEPQPWGSLAGGAALFLGVVVFLRPLVGSLGESLSESAVAMLLLLTAVAFWLGGRVASGEIRVHAGPAALAFVLFMVVAWLSVARAPDRFAAARWWLLIATYGTAAGVLFHVSLIAEHRRYLWACLLATCVALAGYAVWHRAFYVPALRSWLAADPALVQAATAGAEGGARDLAARIASGRAYGNFLTANQLASFILLGVFPLAGLAWAGLSGRSPRPRALLATAGACLALMFVALALSGSKGALIGLAFGGAVFLALGAWVRRPGRLKVIGVLAVLAVGVAGAWAAGLLPSPHRLARSFAVRTGYWQTSLQMANDHPLLGVGPGAWADWYGMLKEPGFEDARNAHSVFLQMAAETGWLGLALWAAVCAAVVWGCLRLLKKELPQQPAAVCSLELWLAGPAMAAGILLFDSQVIGTLAPPRYAPGWLEAMPWLSYLVVFVLWTAAFAGLMADGTPLCSRKVGVGIVAGLAAFLLHSAGEHTLLIPAVGSTAAAVVGLGLGCAAGEGGLKLGPRVSRAALVAAVLAVPAWAALVVRPAVLAAGEAQAAWVMPLAEPAQRAFTVAQVSRSYARACEAVPCESKYWRDRAAWEMGLLQRGGGHLTPDEVVAIADRAVQLSPLNSAGWRLLGAARVAAGDATGSAEALGEAARLAPTLPLAWYEYGRALEHAGAARGEARDAYARALRLQPEQYGGRNRVLGGPAELAAFWRQATGQAVEGSPVALAMALGDARARRKVSELTAAERNEEDVRLERRVWDELAPVLWRIGLEAKVKSVGGGAPGGQPDGASGGT